MLNIIFPIPCKYCNKELKDHNKLSNHLKIVHKIKFEDWYIENYLDNKRPKCANPECNKFVEYASGKFRKVCSRKCRIIVVNKSENGRAAMKKSWTPERRKKQSETLSNIYNNPEIRKRIGKLVKESLSSADIRNKISKKVVESMLYENSKNKNLYFAKKGFKKNELNNLNFKNQYELEVFKILDNDTNISKWYYECVPIKLSNDKYTNVDLEIFYTNGTKKIVEIRHQYFPDNEFKRLNDIKNYCDNNNYIFEIWSEKEIETLKSVQESKTIWGIY